MGHSAQGVDELTKYLPNWPAFVQLAQVEPGVGAVCPAGHAVQTPDTDVVPAGHAVHDGAPVSPRVL